LKKLTGKARNVKEFLEELEKNKSKKPDQVREGLEMYVELWKKAIGNGVVPEADDLEVALAKVEGIGGLYKAAEG